MNPALNIRSPMTSALVLGMGVTGYSIARHLHARGVQVTLADSRISPPCLQQLAHEFTESEIITGEIPFSRFAEFDEVVASPGVDLTAAQGRLAPLVIGDIELFVRESTAPIIAITGSNGKSTVTTLVYEMLCAQGINATMGGNIGKPVLELLEQGDVPDVYVLELSSFQLELTCSLRAASACMLNLSEDHMDRYPAMQDYAEAKLRIYTNARCAVFNRRFAGSTHRIDCKHNRTFGLDPPPTDRDYGVGTDGNMYRGRALLVRSDAMTLRGQQNMENTLAAMALIEGAGYALTGSMTDAMLAFGGLPHRCEVVARINGICWINDSKATNVGAALAALHSLDDDLVLIAGGRGKGADFSPLAAAVAGRVRHTILIGEDAADIAHAIGDASPVSMADSLQAAVRKAKAIARHGDTVLFSPACASFDMFDGFEHRGDTFKQLIMEQVH